eukprot:64852-Hanusia_phi.AAC.6
MVSPTHKLEQKISYIWRPLHHRGYKFHIGKDLYQILELHSHEKADGKVCGPRPDRSSGASILLVNFT